jgi:hypothetical protein
MGTNRLWQGRCERYRLSLRDFRVRVGYVDASMRRVCQTDHIRQFQNIGQHEGSPITAFISKQPSNKPVRYQKSHLRGWCWRWRYGVLSPTAATSTKSRSGRRRASTSRKCCLLAMTWKRPSASSSVSSRSALRSRLTIRQRSRCRGSGRRREINHKPPGA